MVRKSIFTKRAKEERSIEGFTRNIRFLHSTLKHTVLTDVRVTIYCTLFSLEQERHVVDHKS